MHTVVAIAQSHANPILASLRLHSGWQEVDIGGLLCLEGEVRLRVSAALVAVVAVRSAVVHVHAPHRVVVVDRAVRRDAVESRHARAPSLLAKGLHVRLHVDSIHRLVALKRVGGLVQKAREGVVRVGHAHVRQLQVGLHKRLEEGEHRLANVLQQLPAGHLVRLVRLARLRDNAVALDALHQVVVHAAGDGHAQVAHGAHHRVESVHTLNDEHSVGGRRHLPPAAARAPLKVVHGAARHVAGAQLAEVAQQQVEVRRARVVHVAVREL
mmetsp:Transcript_9751/g.30548  ORF Transcript_9751/g.30548 Transcript_9751/m.30548 type:complete len:269 (-) Transcript_9751:12-818(-)